MDGWQVEIKPDAAPVGDFEPEPGYYTDRGFQPFEPVPSVMPYTTNGKLVIEVLDIADGGVVYCDPLAPPPPSQ